MERSEVSIHEIRVFNVFRANPGRWMSNHDVAAKTEGIAHRTVRAHTGKLVKAGILDQAEVFPGHRYRLSEMAAKRNPAYTRRLEQAASVFGEPEPALTA